MALHEAIKLYNPTEENFVGTWDGESYDIPAKSEKYFAKHIAEHFAKHLANKILLQRFDNLCKVHASSNKDTIKTCSECKLRSDKLGALYEVPERGELMKIILPQEITTDTQEAE